MKGRADSARFCSQRCFLLMEAVSHPQRMVGEVLEVLGLRHAREWPVGRRYHADFYLPAHAAAVEVDGTFWHAERRNAPRDRKRDEELARLGIQVIRIREADVREHAFQAVVGALAEAGLVGKELCEGRQRASPSAQSRRPLDRGLGWLEVPSRHLGAKEPSAGPTAVPAPYPAMVI
jgi:very-short-patch-repair endonuclease